jgi:hypothetical protein
VHDLQQQDVCGITMNIPIDFISPWQWVDVNVKH